MQVLNTNTQFLFNDKPNLGKKIAKSLKIIKGGGWLQKVHWRTPLKMLVPLGRL